MLAIIDRVKFDGLKSRDWLVYKYPNEKIVMGSQLIVNEGQVAVFVKGGQIYDLFYPGAYRLTTDNLPILSNVLNLFYGNKTPFSAEIYYINLATKLDMYWGTPDPIQLIDPKYFVKLRIRSYGQLALRLDDPLLFFKEIIVSLNKDDLVVYDKVQDYFRGMLITYIKTALANKIIKEKISALDIAAEIPGITNDLKGKIAEEFKLYGFTLINFHIQSINFPDEDFDQINIILKDLAKMEMLGEERYEKMRNLDISEKAASNRNGMGTFVTSKELSKNSIQQNKELVKQAFSQICPSCNGMIASSSKFCNLCGIKIEPKTICPSCEYENEGDSNFCTSCGTKLARLFCHCGNELHENDRYCNNCGNKVEPIATE